MKRKKELEDRICEIARDIRHHEIEIEDLNDQLYRHEEELRKLKDGIRFTYGTAIRWNDMTGLIVGFVGQCIEVVFKGTRSYFEERIRTDDTTIHIIDAHDAMDIFNAFRADGKI